MKVDLMEPAAVQRNWPWLTQLLAPSVAVDQAASLDTVSAMLARGDMTLATVHVPNGAGVVVIHVADFDGVTCMWLPYIAGHIRGGPKRWVQMMREILAFFEAAARQVGCVEVRIGGRDYSRVFPDYERFDNMPRRLRKVL